MSKWTAICIIAVAVAFFGALASANFAHNGNNNTTTVVCPKGTNGSAGSVNGHDVVIICSPK